MVNAQVISNFWRWFGRNESRLRSLEVTELVDQLYAILGEIDQALEIEIALNSSGHKTEREVVISGSGIEAAMATAKSLVAAAPHCEGWRFVALKPAMGFRFSTDRYGLRIDASRLYFERLFSKQQPGALGIRVYCPDTIADNAMIKDLVWHIVRTGIGEQDAACISAILIEGESKRSADALPISELEKCVEQWRGELN